MKLHRKLADAKIKPVTEIVCPNGDSFGLDIARFRTTSSKPKVTCPFCGTPTPITKEN